MTLKAAVIYVQGSGGNFLSRALSLSEDTIAYTPPDLCQQQPTLEISAAERLAMYQNWNHQNWSHTETTLLLWYRFGLVDFFKYQHSKLKMIAQFHPAEFAFENKQKVLWSSVKDWENLIFIDWDEASLTRIVNLAKIKRRDCQHEQQILTTEVQAFADLKNLITDRIEVKWEDLLEIESFSRMMNELSKKLDITVDIDLAKELWSSWMSETAKLENQHL
jgi:hypothetical protein